MSDYDKNELVFFVNGKKVIEHNPDPEVTLLQYLRDNLRLTGAKLGCGEGGCGACTVMVSKYDRVKRHIHHLSVNACLAPLCSMHGLAVTTTEAIGDTKTRLHPVQERLARSHGSQCGFCTPGMVMSMYTLLRNNSCPSMADLEHAFEGNLCRCTGYRPILDAFQSFTKEFQCPMGEHCCQNQEVSKDTISEIPPEKGSDFVPYDPTQEPIFPSELQLNDRLDKTQLIFSSDRVTWYRPTTLDDLVTLKSTYPTAKLVIGNTEVGLEIKLKGQHYPVVIAATNVPELLSVEKTGVGVRLGASTTLTTLKEVLQELVNTEPEYKTRVYVAIIEMLRWFAGKQIRNVASIAGNIMTASPISDLNPLLLSAQCQLTVASKDRGQRTIVMDDQFFHGYRKISVKPDEVLISVIIPFTRQNEFFCGYKQAHRREDDIAIVNAGLRVVLKEEDNTIEEMGLSFGGMSPHTVMATATAKGLIGKKWDDDLVPQACDLLGKELSLPPGVPGGMESYRNTLSLSFFFKFYLTVQMKHGNKQTKTTVPSSYKSATSVFTRESSHGNQVFQEVEGHQQQIDPIGRALPHLAATQQTTGEAVYVDDMRPYAGELSLALVVSSKAHARLISVDASHALQMPGVVDFIDHKDVPAENNFGCAVHDQLIFAADKVVYQGQVIGAIIAETRTQAQRAAKAVVVTYEELPPILTIQQAIEAGSFLESEPMTLKNGDVEAGFKGSDVIIEGKMSVGGQEHFYLETHGCIAVPMGEDSEMTIFTSTQHPGAMQDAVADTLGVPRNRIVCKTKRLGGAFGGKETDAVLLGLPVAVAANKLQRPVRGSLDRDEDMTITGSRHPFIGKYKVGFTKAGLIQALEVELYSNSGYALDLSTAIMTRAVFHVENSYKIPNVIVRGYCCKTNLPSNTAFRGFGAPQSFLICETWMEKAAHTLNIPCDKLRELNLYKEGELTPYNQPLINCNLSRCWDDVVKQSNYEQRQSDINVFNSENRWKKRGIAVVPVKFGIAFTVPFLNQAGALVHVYTDGSVLLAHGGVEMGQGLHTKMIQVASRALKIPMSCIHITESSTDTVPNASATAASAGSDLNGMAVMRACETIIQRLESYVHKNPSGSWVDWVSAAYMDRVSLSATGFYKTPDLTYNWATNSGGVFNYFTQAAAVSEVEIDTLTGDHTVLRTDIVMDIGQSLNPAIDIGQIEGAFVQGYGLFMLEEERRSPAGTLYTCGPGTYKIPGFADIPVQLNVTLLKGSSNPRAVYSSKAIGEPPLFLAASVFFAVRHAIVAARADVGLNDFFQLDSPATAEKIRMACTDQFTRQFPEAKKGSYTPWVVGF